VDNNAVTANAGNDFTKTCTTNVAGKKIGEATNPAFSYSWKATDGLSDTAISNPIANPVSTTTYTVTKTNIQTGCSNTDEVIVTVDNNSVTANAGKDFTKTCTSNLSGKQIGEDNDPAFSYAWSAASGLSDAAISNPIANPVSTTTYTVTKTNKSNGCSNIDQAIITVDNIAPILAITNPASPCYPGTVNLTSDSVSIGSTLPAITILSYWTNQETNNAVIDPTAVIAGNYWIKATTEKNGCIDTKAVTVALNICTKPVNPTPVECTNLIMTVFPNPYSDEVKFRIISPQSGEGLLEIFDFIGRKLDQVNLNDIQKCITKTFNYNTFPFHHMPVVYKFTIGNYTMVGRLIPGK
jgi:hypothetical protein